MTKFDLESDYAAQEGRWRIRLESRPVGSVGVRLAALRHEVQPLNVIFIGVDREISDIVLNRRV